MKTILDLCGGTGSWSKPYKEAGYNVYNITLPKYDITKKEVQDFCVSLNPYGILAAPPCTMFSLARTRAKKQRDFKEGMNCVRACLDVIWRCREFPLYRKDGSLKFWAIENPKGFLRQFLGKPYFNFDPCDFGHNYTKSTDIWGYFNKPKKRPYSMTIEEKKLCATNSRKLPSISEITSSKQSAKRAVTPSGFSEAFFKANK